MPLVECCVGNHKPTPIECSARISLLSLTETYSKILTQRVDYLENKHYPEFHLTKIVKSLLSDKIPSWCQLGSKTR